MSETPSHRVTVFNRCLAKTIDVCVISFLSVILPHPLGVFLGLIYILIHDGFPEGRSLGKRLLGMRVEIQREGSVAPRPCDYVRSCIRNAPLGVATFFGIIPFWGWIFAILLGIPLIAIEIYLMATREGGQRLGDVMADTVVVIVSPKQ